MMQYDSTQPMRDVLLIKCKTSIEELQQEIESLQRNKSHLEEKCSKAEYDYLEKEKALKDERYMRDKAEGFNILLITLISIGFKMRQTN